MPEIRYPDYNNSILNLMSSILKHYNVETNHNSLEILDKKLEKNYKNVVLIVLDGMGQHILEHTSKDGYFLKKDIRTLTSVYPSTTTAALTTYYSGKPPYETGWIAWSQYFKEYGRAIDMLAQKESYQNDTLKNVRMNVFESIVNYETIFKKIEEASPDVNAYEIMPDYSSKRARRTLKANNIEDICEHIKLICNNRSENRNFAMAYCDNPDALLHKYGRYSDEAKEMIINAEQQIERLREELKDDTIIIISADHGHKEVNKVYNIIDYPEIQECLIMPPSFEPRCLSLFVKNNMKQRFEEMFNENFSNEFILLTKEKVLEKNLIGVGAKHKKIDDFIGDYLAISTSDAVIQLDTYLAEPKPLKKSTHCGISIDEMEVPLIIIE